MTAVFAGNIYFGGSQSLTEGRHNGAAHITWQKLVLVAVYIMVLPMII